MSTVNESSLSHEVKEKIAFALTEAEEGRELSINDERDPPGGRAGGRTEGRRIDGRCVYEMGIRSTVMAPPRRHPGDTLTHRGRGGARLSLVSLGGAVGDNDGQERKTT